MDSGAIINYAFNMLTGIRIFTSDAYWRKILLELNADVQQDAIYADVNLDNMDFKTPISPMEFKVAVLDARDDTRVVDKILGRQVQLSPIQNRILRKLYETGGMTSDELKVVLGYAADATTHTVDTTIYGLRKLFGKDIIINKNGKFVIGRV